MYLLDNVVTVLDPLLWITISFIFMEGFFIAFLLWMFRNIPDSLRYVVILQFITLIFAMTSFFVITNVEYAATSFVVLSSVPLFFILLNYILGNYLFLRFDFNSFLKQQIERFSKDKHLSKIFLIESLDFVPNDRKLEEGRRVARIFRKQSGAILSNNLVKENLEALSSRIQSESFHQNIQLLIFYLEITYLHQTLNLPFKDEIVSDSLVQISALKRGDYIALGTLCSSFFEGFIRNIRQKLEGTIEISKIEDNLRKNGSVVASKLNLPEKEVHKIADIRNNYIHRNMGKIKDKHNDNLFLILEFTLRILHSINEQGI